VKKWVKLQFFNGFIKVTILEDFYLRFQDYGHLEFCPAEFFKLGLWDVLKDHRQKMGIRGENILNSRFQSEIMNELTKRGMVRTENDWSAVNKQSADRTKLEYKKFSGWINLSYREIDQWDKSKVVDEL
jgi:hypothetical protein